MVLQLERDKNVHGCVWFPSRTRMGMFMVRMMRAYQHDVGSPSSGMLLVDPQGNARLLASSLVARHFSKCWLSCASGGGCGRIGDNHHGTLCVFGWGRLDIAS